MGLRSFVGLICSIILAYAKVFFIKGEYIGPRVMFYSE